MVLLVPVLSNRGPHWIVKRRAPEVVRKRPPHWIRVMVPFHVSRVRLLEVHPDNVPHLVIGESVVHINPIVLIVEAEPESQLE